MYRKTYAEIKLENIKYNVKSIKNYLKDYKYFIGVVKADSYSHFGNIVVNQIIDSGCNYLAVATLEEALEIRKDNKDIPILCLGRVENSDLEICNENNITISILSIEHLNKLDLNILHSMKIHLKINTGMNRLGISNKYELEKVIKILKANSVFIEGIYMHVFDDINKQNTFNQIKAFENITSIINLKDIPIVHFGASGYILNYPKVPYVNGCRFGIAMYGLAESNLNLKSTFSLYSTIIQINEVEDATVGYGGAYSVKGKEKIAIVPIGYADGIIRKNTGRKVYINNQAYQIVGNICMDMLFVKVDDSVKVGDKVILIKDNEHIKKIAKHLDTISYEVICSIGKRIPRIYK